MVSGERSDEVLALHEALTHLEAVDPRKAKVMELRYFGGFSFGGFSIEEIADILKLSPRSVKRDWALARIWLLRQMKEASQGSRQRDPRSRRCMLHLVYMQATCNAAGLERIHPTSLLKARRGP